MYAVLHRERDSGRNEGKVYYNVDVYLDRGESHVRRPATPECVPTAALLRLAELADARSMPLELTCVKRRRFVSAQIAERFLRWVAEKGQLKGEARELYERILDYIRGDLVAVSIRSIRKKPYSGYVYDLSVPGTESFIGGDIPVLLHNTGHGGLTTLHAEHIDAAVKRLTSPPMNIPQSYIPLMNFALVIKRVMLYRPDGSYFIARRITNVWEVLDYNEYDEVAKWLPAKDRHELYTEKSKLLRDIAESRGKDERWIEEELERRRTVLQWMRAKGIRFYKDVATIVHKYYAKPLSVYEVALRELREIKGGV